MRQNKIIRSFLAAFAGFLAPAVGIRIILISFGIEPEGATDAALGATLIGCVSAITAGCCWFHYAEEPDDEY